MRPLVSLLLIAALSGCVYKIDVQQGNLVTQDLVDKLKPGMTRAEVKQLLGTPLLNDVFHQNEWDYYFANARGGRVASQPSRLTVYFKDDKMASYAGAGRSGRAAADSPSSLSRTER
ncbi:MAG TPA: outer membrane protein assembly factor BamE [Usitatibacter sp.]|jgi:outer membrane protein assembly factor BamE|nr:outer membrane protein assembly factor BamE [Usitatibacter sp.]